MSDINAEESQSYSAAKVEPDKSLFIDMLTRDIELIPAILDLWDNSIDGALRFKSKSDRTPPLQGFEIELSVSSSEFRIVDNCGGIPLEVAANYAFRLGRTATSPSVDGAVGSFGVGMKRALFKIGQRFVVQSDSTAGSFKLDVNVPEWAATDEAIWEFPFETADASYSADDIRQTKTDIHVTSLFPAVALQLSDEQFVRRLQHELETRRPEAFDQGITVRLNGEVLHPHHARLKSSSDFAPVVRRLNPQPGVHVEIRAGLVGGKNDIQPDEEGDASRFVGTDEAGWYVLANGRVLLAADRSRLTGWGDDVARYHPQFRNFRGYVDIRADDGRYLPWNTTKTGVDESSPVWKTIYGIMTSVLSEVQTLTTRIKQERRNELDVGIKGPILTAFENAQEVTVREISPPREQPLRYPKPEALSTPATQRINFLVESDRYSQAAEFFDASTGAELGRQLFDYFWNLEVEG